jgi:phage-related minor tail protein
MTDSLKIQGEVSLDSADAEQALGRVEQRAGRMAQAVKQSGKDAGDGVGAIGANADGAAQKVDRATSSLVASIQRTTAAMEAGGKSTSAYYEAIAKQRGISADALKPYLDRLRQLEEQQKKTGSTLSQFGASADKTAQQLRQVAPQITDIVTQLAGGQAPLQILIQQGGQLKDVFGGIGPAARALGGYVASLITPTTLLVAGVGALAVAYIQGSKESREFANALTFTGNALGVTGSQYAQLRDNLAAIAGTKSKAAEALTEIARAGVFTRDSVQGIAEAAVLMERATGQSISKTVDQFKELAKSPSDAAAKLNDQYHFLTGAIYDQIKALEDQGRAQDAATLAMQTYSSAVAQRGKEIIDNLGYVETKFQNLVIAAKKGWDAVANVGRDQTGNEQLEQLRKTLADRLQRGPLNDTAKAAYEKGNEALRQQIALLERLGGLQQQQTKDLAEKARLDQLYISYQKDGERFEDRQAKMQKELNKAQIEGQQLVNAGKLTQIQLEQRLAEIRRSYAQTGGLDELAGIRAAAKAAQEQIDLLRKKMADSDPTGLTKLTDAERKVLEIQEKLAVATDRVTQANLKRALSEAQTTVSKEKEAAATQRQYDLWIKSIGITDAQTTANDRLAQSYRQQADEQKFVADTFGKSEIAVKQAMLAQTNINIAEADASDRFDPKYIASLYNKKAALEELIPAMQAVANKQAVLNNIRLGEANQRDADLLQYELSVIGQVADVRLLLIERRRIELEYAQRIAEIDRKGLDPSDAAARKAELEQQKQIALNNATTHAIVEQWQRAADEIDDSLTNAIEDWVLNGKSLSKSLANAIKQEFGNLVLRPTIQAAINSTGLPALLGGSVSGGSGLIGQALGLDKLLPQGGILGALGLTSTAATTSGVATSSVFNAAADSQLANAAGLTGSASSGLASFLGPAGLIAGALALSGIFGKSHGPKTEGGTGNFGSTPLTGDSSAAQQLADGISSIYSTAADAIGLANDKLKVGLFFSKDPNGTAQSQLAIQSANFDRGTVLGSVENAGRTDAEFQKALTLSGLQDVFTELQSAISNEGLTGAVADFVKSIDPLHTSLEDLQADFQKVQDIGAFQKAIDSLGPTFASLKNLSVDAAEALVQASGGLDKLTSNLQTYYSNFLTPEEQRQNTVNAITSTLTAAGVDVTVDQISHITREQFRALVESFDPMTTAGDKALAALYGVSGALASITDTATSAAITLDPTAYYKDFLTPDEQRQKSVESITKTLTDAGVQVTADQIAHITKEQFRAIVESYDSTTDAGKKALNALYGVSDAVSSLADVATTATNTIAASLQTFQQSVDAAWNASVQIQQAAAQATAEFNGSVLGMIQGSFDAVRKGITDMVAKIRGDITGEQSGAGSLQQQFQQALTTVMQGGKGSGAAAASLPDLAQQLSAALPDMATSRLDLLTQQAGIAQHLQDAAGALAAQERATLGNTYAALSGSNVTVQQYQPRPVNDYSSNPLMGQLQEMNRSIRRLHTAMEANVSFTASINKNTREAIDRGIPALADPSA